MDSQAVKELIEGEHMWKVQLACRVFMPSGLRVSPVLTQSSHISTRLSLMPVDSRRQLEQWQNGSVSERNLNLSIPLLMQNKVPDGFEDGDHVKVDLRPESVSMNVSCVTELVRSRGAQQRM